MRFKKFTRSTVHWQNNCFIPKDLYLSITQLLWRKRTARENKRNIKIAKGKSKGKTKCAMAMAKAKENVQLTSLLHP